MFRGVTPFALILVLGICPSFAVASFGAGTQDSLATQQPAPSEEQSVPAIEEATPRRPRLRARLLSVSKRSIKLDGRLTEPEWMTADSISNLVTIEPEEGGTPAGRTIVRVLASPTEIIIGFRCLGDPAGIVSYSKARDSELDEQDNILFVLDTFGDERSGYVFAVNPSGSRFDGLVTAQGDDVNSDWDTIWEATVSTDAAGWGGEIRLPIQSLSFQKGLDYWGFNVERRVQSLQETSRWSGTKRDFEIFQTSQAGLLSGLPSFDLGLGLTIRPAVIGEASRPQPGAKRDYDGDISLDLNQKLGSNLTAYVSVNTDFGETEVDARQTNLSRFDLLFPEKRAFFLEGADIFEFGLGLDLEPASILPFFSRRIGIYTPEGEDEGTEVPILAGAKLQGRIGETNLGALVVGTDKVDAFGVPRTEMGAMRVRQNILSESSLGMIATIGDPLGRRSWLVGSDFTYRTSEFREDKNLQMGVWGVAMDRDDIKGEPAFGGKVAYPNDLIDLEMTYFRIANGFQPSLGFVERTGHVFYGAGSYSPRPEGSQIRQLSLGASYFRVNRLDGGWESYAAVLRPLDLQLESGDRVTATIEPTGEHTTETFDVFDSPTQTVEIPIGTYHWTRYKLVGALAPKRRLNGEVSWSFGGFYKGQLRTLEADMVIEPHSALTVRLTTERNMGTLPEGDFTQYLYGGRAEIKLSPDLQLTYFVQYDNESLSLGSATRLRWTFQPLGDLFVSFDHNMTKVVEQGQTHWDFESDRLLVKLQYAFRL